MHMYSRIDLTPIAAITCWVYDQCMNLYVVLAVGMFGTMCYIFFVFMYVCSVVYAGSKPFVVIHVPLNKCFEIYHHLLSRILLGLMLPTWFLSLWLCNLAAVGLTLPIGNAIIKQLKGSDKLQHGKCHG